MQSLLLKNATVVLPDEKAQEASILIEEGGISVVKGKKTRADEVLDLTNLTLYAGFIDIHIHGVVGVDVNDAHLVRFKKLGSFS